MNCHIHVCVPSPFLVKIKLQANSYTCRTNENLICKFTRTLVLFTGFTLYDGIFFPSETIINGLHSRLSISYVKAGKINRETQSFIKLFDAAL